MMISSRSPTAGATPDINNALQFDSNNVDEVGQATKDHPLIDFNDRHEDIEYDQHHDSSTTSTIKNKLKKYKGLKKDHGGSGGGGGANKKSKKKLPSFCMYGVAS